jgi:hypothetical protein
VLTLFPTPIRSLSCLALVIATTAACKSDPSGDEGSERGGSGGGGGQLVTGGSSGTAGATGATGGSTPTGGTSGATNGGSSQGGAAGSAAGATTGGAAGDGATGGASGAGGTAGANGDACARAVFCDDFEDGTASSPPATPWTVQRGGSATAVVDGMHRVSGAQSVKFSVPTGPGKAFIALTNAPVFPAMGNAFFGRVMLWLDAAPTASVHWTIVEATGLVPSQTYHAAYRLGGQHPIMSGGSFAGSQLMANYETPDSYSGNGPGSDCWRHANSIVLPTARWSCVEWSYDGPNNAMTMWVDGMQVVTVSGTGDGCVNQPANYPWTAPTFDTLKLGWESYQTDGARTLWLDDVAISTERVGCPSTMGQ